MLNRTCDILKMKQPNLPIFQIYFNNSIFSIKLSLFQIILQKIIQKKKKKKN